MRKVMLALAALPLLTGGCVRTVYNVATLPVRAGAKAVDLATTSPHERDEKYVRQMRKNHEREDSERRAYDRQCRKDPEHCGPYTGYVAPQSPR